MACSAEEVAALRAVAAVMRSWSEELPADSALGQQMAKEATQLYSFARRISRGATPYRRHQPLAVLKGGDE